MMKIILSPQRRDDSVTYSRSGDTIIANGEAFNFSRVKEGDILPRAAIASGWFAGHVTRVNGELELTLLLPNPENYSPAQAFPIPLNIMADGPIELPKPLETIE